MYRFGKAVVRLRIVILILALALALSLTPSLAWTGGFGAGYIGRALGGFRG